LTDVPAAGAAAFDGALVTGAGGFIGRGVIAVLTARGIRVQGIERPELVVDPAMPDLLAADLTDQAAAAAAIARGARALGGNPIVFHLAGMANATLCRAQPAAAFGANVAAVANVLEAVRRVGLSRIVFPSTALVYALPAIMPLSETAPVGPRTVYAASKCAAEALLRGYADDFGFSLDVARLGNVYGPDGPADSVVGTVLKQLADTGRVRLKTLAPVRDFVHRDDVAEGLVRLARAGEPGWRVFNVASGMPVSIGELAELARQAAGGRWPAEELEPGTRPDDRIALDVRAIRERIGWMPTIALADGLRYSLQSIEREQA
jgi:nucleoside-diphosphate-sugar epimerase